MNEIDLKESVRQWLINNLPYDRNDQALCAELQEKDARELLIVYHNWMSRHVRPVPRTVRKSQAFTSNPIVQQRASDLAVIIQDIEQGRDLTRYLSRGIKTVADSASKPLNRRRDLDLMLNDWNVHHLHISTQLEADGFVKRDGPLMFAAFQPNVAFLIDVMQHGDWTREHVIRVIADEWPDEGIIHEIKGNDRYKVVGLAAKYTEKEHQELRAAGINVLCEIDGRVFMPGGGMVSVGTTVRASRAADQLLMELEKFETFVRNNPDQMREAFVQHGVQYPDEPRFEFVFLHPEGYGVVETVTKTLIPLA